MGFIPVLTRLYAPDEFGMYHIFITCVVLSIPVITMGNDCGITNEKSKITARRFLYRSVILALIISPALTISVLFIYYSGLIVINGSSYLLLFPLVTFLAALGGLGLNWLIRSGEERTIGRAVLINLSVRSIFQSVFGLFGMSLRGLILGEIFGRIFGLYFSDKRFIVLRRFFFRKIYKKSKEKLLTEYSKFVTPKIFVENFIAWAPPFFVALIYGPELGGFMAVVQRIGSSIVTVYNQTIGLMFHRSLVQQSSAGYNKLIHRLIMKWLFLLVIGIVFYIVLFQYSTQIFKNVLGVEWSEAGSLFLLSLPMYVFQACNVLSEKVFLYYLRFEALLITNVITLILMLVVFSVSLSFDYNINQAIVLMSILSAFSYISTMIFSITLLQNEIIS